MRLQKIIGILLIVISAALLVTTILMVADNLAKDGPLAGKINTYKPPYPAHPFMIIGFGISSVVLFLTGSIVTVLARKQ